MKYFVYILYSEKIDRFYTGQTQNLKNRLSRHNSGYEKFTKRGAPWKLMCFIECSTRSEAMKLELRIKNFKSQKRMKLYIQEVVGSEK
ncbi:GIY-YIG nuclease family protein [Wandonia haliotis]|uniref:GIY-YIG nuclease family protein n=1 Tax=Wandonia haliotis TaxID=574963 RepID=UPI0031E3AABC